MNFRYIECTKPNQLIQNFFELNVELSSTPLSSRIIPTAQSHILFFKSQLPLQTGVNNKIFKNKGIVVFGQSYKSYTLLAQKPYYNFGINFHPTALYKILKTDISKFTDQHINLSEVDQKLYQLLDPIFKQEFSGEELANKIEKKLLKLELYESKNTKLVDDAIHVIYKKEGRINVEEILKIFPISQKHLETQFKKTIGLTPLKFIKLFKFVSLMRKYETTNTPISQLIDYYAYYDFSHFTKDFKLFMNLKPSDYFNTKTPFLSNYLKK
ncbi:helix-turn-helix domain-containing protein [uncultured Olleya sp.]|uniref:helix-turn-helix domain-containing protein n=1 Tax=uncultured Olleya sp. TaxID=757243 RepID=UPI0025961664|nr:helix-turn-helix domain-containing protein [uncultured Olleya sp.]